MNHVRRPFRPRRHRCPGLLAIFCLAAGCGGQPQITSANRELIVSLATAVSARNAEWLERNATALEAHRAAKLCTDVEYRTFSQIIERARSGDWKAAEEAVYALRDAQQPTAEDLQNLEARKLDPDHHSKRSPRGNAPGKPAR